MRQIIPAQLTLAALNEGRTMLELSEAFRAATQAVRDHNKNGCALQKEGMRQALFIRRRPAW